MSKSGKQSAEDKYPAEDKLHVGMRSPEQPSGTSYWMLRRLPIIGNAHQCSQYTWLDMRNSKGRKEESFTYRLKRRFGSGLYRWRSG